MNKTLKRWLPDALAVVLFALLAFAYFYPSDTEGRILYQHDTSAGAGAGQEIAAYRQQTGEQSRWTNSLFGGMPTYQIAPSYSSDKAVTTVERAYHLWLPSYVWHLFAYLLGFYILLRAFDFKQYLAALGSVLWAFSTYFLIIIAAGHMWKVMALAYLPPMIGGIVLAFRGRYLWGLLTTALFAALEVHANHVQMTYYYLFVILFMVVAFAIDSIRQRRWLHLLKAAAVCIVGALIGVLINLPNLYHTWEYSKATMRGGSELTATDGSQGNSGGLDREYITQYSYGIGETWSLLIPNVQGGASMKADAKVGTALFALTDNSAAKKQQNFGLTTADGQPFVVDGGNGEPYQVTFNDVVAQMPQYWGDGSTMGPVYVGAFVVLLFVLALFVVRGPMKWALLAATVLSILLAWGRNWQAFTDFFIDYVPMYAKFRTVESILVIAEFTIPLLAMLGLKRIIEEPEVLRRRVSLTTLVACIATLLILLGINAGGGILLWLGLAGVVAVMIVSCMKYMGEKVAFSNILDKQVPLTPLSLSLIMTGGALLVFAIAPTAFFSFVSSGEGEWLAQFGSSLRDALVSIRTSIFTADCWRSLAIIAIGTACLWLYMTKRLKALPTVAIIAVLCLFDLWQVNKNYLNDGMFRDKSIIEETHRMTPLDEYLLQDKTLDYRVLNMPYDDRQLSAAFNENNTSYYHKSVGGYHAAKMQRYQDLIDHCLYREMQNVNHIAPLVNYDLDSLGSEADMVMPVLNMLNTRYIVVKREQGIWPMLNNHAFGNAWFVDNIKYVPSPDAEISALQTTELRHEAVADKQFEAVLGQAAAQDSTTRVQLTSYAPNRLTYDVESTRGGVLVFSEIYYPSWTATVDGKPAQLGRVNYVLRAMHIDGGRHQVELTFQPSSVSTTQTVAYIAMIVLVAIAAAIVIINLRKKKEIIIRYRYHQSLFDP